MEKPHYELKSTPNALQHIFESINNGKVIQKVVAYIPTEDDDNYYQLIFGDLLPNGKIDTLSVSNNNDTRHFHKNQLGEKCLKKGIVLLVSATKSSCNALIFSTELCFIKFKATESKQAKFLLLPSLAHRMASSPKVLSLIQWIASILQCPLMALNSWLLVCLTEFDK